MWRPYSINSVDMAPFETFPEHYIRANSDTPYDESFRLHCRKKALEYAKEDTFLRDNLLQDLYGCVPVHFRGQVFEGISWQKPSSY